MKTVGGNHHDEQHADLKADQNGIVSRSEY